MYTILLVPIYTRYLLRNQPRNRSHHSRVSSTDLSENDSNAALLGPEDDSYEPQASSESIENHNGRTSFDQETEQHQSSPLSIRDTFWLSAKFCGLWFFSNWMNSGSYEKTSVASSTILVSTSSVFALLFGVIFRVETLTIKKVAGVLASISGVVLISMIDTNKPRDDENRGSFPYKSPAQIVVGDGMALLSAMLYGLYATFLTKHVGSEDRVNMPLFFGFIGIIVLVALWPGIPILHILNVERFALPPTRKVALVILANAVISMISDICWGLAVLLTSPLVVTVGLTLTIPLSLVGQIIINAQYSSGLYWLGAVIIVISFTVVSLESKIEEEDIPET